MNGLNFSAFDGLSGPSLFAVLLTAKVTALLAIAWLVHLAFGGANPRWRVLLWRGVAAGTVTLIALALCPPLWSLAVLPAASDEVSEVAQLPVASPVSPGPSEREGSAFQPIAPERLLASDVAEPLGASSDLIPETPMPGLPEVDETAPATALAPLAERRLPRDEHSASSPSALSLASWIAVIWLVGVMACALYRAAGLWHLLRVSKGARSVPEWIESEAGAVAQQLAIRRRFAVCQTERLPVPCLVGLFRPVVLLPQQQCERSYAEELPAILAHELAHLKGGDLAWSRFLHALSILLWFHPLAWRLPRAHGDACDAVCDAVAADYVGDAGLYGRTLARLALRLASGGGPVGLAMARKSNVRRRVEALQRFVFRTGLPRWRMRTALLAATAAVLLLGGLALTRSNAAPAEDGNEVAAKESSDKVAEHEQSAESVLTIRCVADQTGEPMAGVELEFHGRIGGKALRQTLQTDERGEAALKRVAGARVEYLWMTARKSRYVPLHYTWQSDRRTIELPESLDLRFEEGIKIGGIVEDEAGQPVAGAAIDLSMPITWPRLVSYFFSAAETKTGADGRWEWDSAPKAAGTVNLIAKHPDYLEGGTGLVSGTENRLVLRQGLQVSGRVVDLQGGPIAGATAQLGRDRFGTGEPRATTNSEGRFVIKDCKPGRSAVTVQADGMAPEIQEVTVGKSDNALEFHLSAGHTLRGRILDVEGEPIAGVTVVPDTWRGYRTLARRMKTDSEGKFTWQGAPADAVEYDIFKQGYMSNRNLSLLASEKEQVITLFPELEVHGRVTDAKTGKPVPKFRIVRGRIQWNSDNTYWTRDEGVRYAEGRYSYKFNEPMRGWLLRVVAPGYLPATSRVFESDEGRQQFDFALQPGEGVSGLVLLANGNPAEGAEVGMATAEKRASLTEGRFDQSQNSADVTTTDAKGRFSFAADEEENFLLIVVHEQGYAEVTKEELAESGRIALQPWGRLEGTVMLGDRADAGREVVFWPKRPSRPGMGMVVWDYGYRAKTDEEGRFQFDRVIPGLGAVARVVVTDYPRGSSHCPCWQTPVEIVSYRTAKATVGGTGQAVRGRVVLGREPETPIDWTMNDPVEIVRWDREKGKRTEDYARYCGNIDKSGRFEIPDVPTGDYKLTVSVNNPPTPGVCGAGSQIGRAELQLSIPEMPGGRSDEPLDLGAIEAKLFDTLDVGEIAPEFVVQQFSGEPLRLEHYRGKLILLDFWATWCQPCLAEMPNLKRIHGQFGADPRFVLVSIACDNSISAARDYAEKNGLAWRQAHIPGIGNSIAKAYTIRSLPATFLIAPDGHVLAKNQRGDELNRAVAAALTDDALFNVDVKARPPRFPVTRFDVSQNSSADLPAVVVLDNTDPKYDRDEPRHDNLRALDLSGKQLWRHTGFNVCQTVGGGQQVAIDRRRRRIYVCENAGNKLHAFSPDGQRVWRIDNIEADALAVDGKTGDLWCSVGQTLNAGETVVFDSEGREKTSFFHRGIDMAYDPENDSFWLAGYEVVNLDREGKVRFREKVGGWCCSSVAVNVSDGSVWMVERDHPDVPKSKNRLWLRNADGTVRHTVDLEDLNVFSVECVPKNGDAWVEIYGCGLRRYSPEGRFIDELPIEGRSVAISPTSGEIWMNTEEAAVRIDASGKVLARSPHDAPSRQAWLVAF